MSLVTFHHPTIGPKAYMARGTSGWVEMFKRKQADQALASILGDHPLLVVVEGFRAQLKLTTNKLDWSAIVGYLSWLLGVTEKHIPDEAAVAFWCQVILATRAETEAKVN